MSQQWKMELIQQQQQEKQQQPQQQDKSQGGGQQTRTMISFVLTDPAKYNELASTGHGRYAWTVYNSILYGVILVLFGMTFAISEAVRGEWMNFRAASVFSAYLHGVSILFLIYMEIDAFLLSRRRKKQQSDMKSDHDASVLESTFGEGSHPAPSVGGRSDVSLSSSTYSLQYGVEPQHHYITYLDGQHRRHRTNFPRPLGHGEGEVEKDTFSSAGMHTEGTTLYVRSGFLVFAVGNLALLTIELLVYSKLEMAGCPNTPSLSPKYWHLAFLLTQTLFIVKNSKLAVERNHWLVRYGLMHVLANNIIVWIRTLTEEVVVEYAHLGASQGIKTEQPADEPGHALSRRLLASVSGAGEEDGCQLALLGQVQPYLFPFILEYSLTAVAIYATMYQSLILRLPTALYVSMQKCFANVANTNSEVSEKHEDESHIGQSIFGVISGITISAVAMAAVGVYFFQTEVRSDRLTASLVVSTANVSVLISLLFAIGLAVYKLWHFRFTTTRDSSIDSTLLVISLAGLIFMGVFELVRTVGALSGHEGALTPDEYRLCVTLNAMVVFELFQAVVQTCFILDGLNRYAHRRQHFVEKPGRNCITFLIIVNVTLWLFKSLLMKDILLEKTLEAFGGIAGPLIINVNLPLALFFRFHSSVCLAEMWSCVYEPVFEIA